MLKTEILRKLQIHNDFLSGQELCEEYQVSRTAVWKAIKQLKEEGYEIESVNNKGYRLVESPDVISEAAILSRLKTKRLGRTLYYDEEMDSTNDYLKRLSAEEQISGVVATCEEQTKGKGRLGRVWASSRGNAIYVSSLLKPDIAPEHASSITILGALATAKALETVIGTKCGIKWPNDIVYNGKKLCGILTEMSTDMDQIQYVIVGIGINVNMTSFSEEIASNATSVRLITGKSAHRADIICDLLNWLEVYYEEFCKTEDLSYILEEYNDRLVNYEQQVRIIERNKEWTGVAHGINERGELLVTDEDGQERVVYSGEVSVRGIYGYV